MIRPVVLFLLGACTAVGTTVAQNVPTRTLRGRIISSATKRPAYPAQVLVEGTAIGASAEQDGSYILANVPTTAITLVARAIGYRPGRTPVPAGTESLVVDAVVLETPHSRPDPERLPLNSDEQRAIWRALLLGLRLRAAGDTHLRDLARMVPTARFEVASGQSTVILMSPSGAQNTRPWLDSLTRERIIAGVCRSNAERCPQRGNHYFAALRQPMRFAEDSVVVTVDYTAGNPSLCRRGHTVYDSGTETFILARVSGTWVYVSEDQSAMSIVGGVYC